MATVDERIGRCLDTQCCSGGLCEDVPGLGEIYFPMKRDQLKDTSERIQRFLGSTGSRLSSAPGLASPGPGQT